MTRTRRLFPVNVELVNYDMNTHHVVHLMCNVLEPALYTFGALDHFG
jgi:hypothetical protein